MTRHQNTQSTNFGFLREHDPALDALAGQAERYFSNDPNTSLIKLRQFGETLAQLLANVTDVKVAEDDDFLAVLDLLWDRKVLPPPVAKGFHDLRREGNRAVHQNGGTPAEALQLLKTAHHVSVWFHMQACGHRELVLPVFVLSENPTASIKVKPTIGKKANGTALKRKATKKKVAKKTGKKIARKVSTKKVARKKVSKRKVAKKKAAKKKVARKKKLSWASAVENWWRRS